jgi:hypothetical protein
VRCLSSILLILLDTSSRCQGVTRKILGFFWGMLKEKLKPMPPKNYKNLSIPQRLIDTIASQPDYEGSITQYIEKAIARLIAGRDSAITGSADDVIAAISVEVAEWDKKKVGELAIVLLSTLMDKKNIEEAIAVLEAIVPASDQVWDADYKSRIYYGLRDAIALLRKEVSGSSGYKV